VSFFQLSQMLSDPSVLLLDEPTSGLDSTSACHLMRTLRRLATDRGRTVIASIHQPRSDLYALFDQILLLSRGHVVYAGAAGDAMLRHFGTLGHECPPLFNPSDWVLDLSSVDLRNPAAEDESRARVAALVEGYKASSSLQTQMALVQGVLSAASESSSSSSFSSSSSVVASPAAESDADADNESSTASCWKAFPVLVARSFVHFGRSPIIISARIFQVLSYALILAIYFAPMGNDQRFIQNRLGLLQQYTPILFIGMLNCFAVFINERNVFWRERADGAYETAPFFLSYMCGELPFEVLGAVLFSVVVGPLIGMGASPAQFFVTCFTTLCVLFAGESIGILFCAFIRHAGFAVSLVNSVLTTFTIMAGLMSFDMSPILRTVNYISVRVVTRDVDGGVIFCVVPRAHASSPSCTHHDSFRSCATPRVSTWCTSFAARR
jgi:hypothetical protein